MHSVGVAVCACLGARQRGELEVVGGAREGAACERDGEGGRADERRHCPRGRAAEEGGGGRRRAED
eukprot:4689010-Prymnesium_polylepis.1